jgi:hypothetical protein
MSGFPRDNLMSCDRGRRPWHHDHRSLVRITIATIDAEATDDDVVDALKAALAAYRKLASRQSGAA